MNPKTRKTLPTASITYKERRVTETSLSRENAMRKINPMTVRGRADSMIKDVTPISCREVSRPHGSWNRRFRGQI